MQISLDGLNFITLPGNLNVPTQFGATATALTSSISQSPVGTSVTFTATVMGGSGTPLVA